MQKWKRKWEIKIETLVELDGFEGRSTTKRQRLLVTLTTAAEATEDGALAQNPFGRHSLGVVITSAESILLPFNENGIQKEHAVINGIQHQ